jgi:ADP-ribose pyrophosphatase YjhB (NUDIX family)
MKFCPDCGARVVIKIPPGEDRERFVCEACATVHYQNPKIIAGSVPLWQGKILLCRRAIEPRYGLWTLPAGFMELGESLDEAARRETWEEARAEVNLLGLYTVFSLPHVNQVHIFFRAELSAPSFAPGPESLETRLFEATDIPWQELAFSTVHRTLAYLLEDQKRQRFEVRVEHLPPSKPRP